MASHEIEFWLFNDVSSKYVVLRGVTTLLNLKTVGLTVHQSCCILWLSYGRSDTIEL